MNPILESKEYLEWQKILEEMPLGYTMKMKVGENDYALKMVRKMPGNKDATIEDIKRHNEECKAWEQGFKAAIDKIREWRNEQYLILKNLK